MYTPDEIQSSIEKLVRSSVRRPVDSLGVRRSDVSFSDVQEAAAGVFLLYPNAPYYVISLGAKRLLDRVAREAELLQRLLDAIDAAGRRTLPVGDVSSLFNARSALEELESASATRRSGFKDITKLPSYQRFDANIQAFLSGPGANIKANGRIVQTPEQARKALPKLVNELREQHSGLVEALRILGASLDDYASVNLPSLVTQGAVGRSRQVLDAHARDLDALSGQERLEKVRDVTLDVLAAKAVVKALGSFRGPSDFVAMNGVARPYSDGTHLATPAVLASELLNAYAILAGENELDVALDDGSGLVQIFLAPSVVAALDGIASEGAGSPCGFLIGDGVNPPPPVGSAPPRNNRLQVNVSAGSSSQTYTATLTTSASFTALTSAEQIAADLNAALPAGVRARPVFFPLRYSGPLDIAASSGARTTASVPGGSAADFVALGVVPGDVAAISIGTNQGLHTIVSVPGPGQLILERRAGAFAEQRGAPSEVGPALRRLRLACVEPRVQVPAQTALTIVATDAVAQAGATTIGLVPGISSRCLRSTAQEVVESIVLQTSAIDAAARFTPVRDGLQGRVSTTSPLQVSLAQFSARADARFAGPLLTLRGSFGSADVKAGSALVLRTGPNQGLAGTVTSVNPESMTAAMSSAGTDAFGVLFDVGVALPSIEYQTLRVATGPNQGDYLVDGVGPTPLDLRLKRALPFLGQGSPHAFTAALGDKAVVFLGRTATTSSVVQLSGPAATLFFGRTPASAAATSSYVVLPEAPRGLQPGDQLEVYTADYRVPSQIFRVQAVEGTLSVIRVSPELAATATLRFGEGPPPFARLRFARAADFAAFRGQLDAWLARPAQQPNFFTDLHRFINPLLAGSPTAVQVGAAKQRLGLLRSGLTIEGAALAGDTAAATIDVALQGFDVDPVPAIDTLLRSYKEKGSDRATDLLLQGRFATFFGLSIDEASFSGTMQAAMRDVARSDVPIRKTSRLEAVQGRALANATSPDYELDQSDNEASANPART